MALAYSAISCVHPFDAEEKDRVEAWWALAEG